MNKENRVLRTREQCDFQQSWSHFPTQYVLVLDSRPDIGWKPKLGKAGCVVQCILGVYREPIGFSTNEDNLDGPIFIGAFITVLDFLAFLRASQRVSYLSLALARQDCDRYKIRGYGLLMIDCFRYVRVYQNSGSQKKYEHRG